MFSAAFLSDEGIYVYAAYVMKCGVKPYSQITLVHPPLMYLTYAGFMELFGADLVLVRIFSITLFLISMFLIYCLAELLGSKPEGYAPKNIGLACAALYAFYPFIIPFSIASPLVNMLTIFTLGCTIFYIKFLQHKKKALMLLSGVFAGLAFMTWYIATFFIVTIFFFEIFRAFLQGEKIRACVKQITLMIIGAAIPVVTILSWIFFVLHSFPHFYIQTFVLQTSRAGLTPFEKWSSINAYINYFYPLLIAGTVGVPALIRHVMKSGISAVILPAWLFITNFIFLSVIPKTTFLHYFLYLSPYLVFISIIGSFNILRLIPKNWKKIADKQTAATLLSVLAVLTVISASVIINSLISFSPYFSNTPNQYTKAELYVGSYVANLTSPLDKIWTSEPGIAFFAKRVIEAPNSTYWSIQGFFNDVFDTAYTDTYGVTHHGLGIVTPDLFIQAWEGDRVKVLIFIRGIGPVPYPDDLLWFGYPSQVGVKSWVESNFELTQIVVAQGVAYTYEIWVRK
jgi:4-amino-4-deoxy-L-arabinose transferase-like glycosyltransferase